MIDRADRSSESGIFQAFTSYLSSYAADDPPEPSEDELDSTMCTMDCINASSMEEIFSNIMYVPPRFTEKAQAHFARHIPSDHLHWLLSSLLARLPEESSPVVIMVKPELPAHSPTRPYSDRINPDTSAMYDPGVVYILELATIIALRDQDTIRTLGKEVFEALHHVVRNAASTHPVVVSRAVFYLLNLLCVGHVSDRCSLKDLRPDNLQEQPFIRAPVILHTISSFSQGTMSRSAMPTLKGFEQCIKASSSLRKEITNSPDFWSILQAMQSIQEASGNVFMLLEDVTTGPRSAVTADNYESAIALLNDYATAGSIGAVQEQRMDKAARRSKSVKATKPQ